MKRLNKKVGRRSLLSSDTESIPKCGKCCEMSNSSMGFFEAMTFTK